MSLKFELSLTQNIDINHIFQDGCSFVDLSEYLNNQFDSLFSKYKEKYSSDEDKKKLMKILPAKFCDFVNKNRYIISSRFLARYHLIKIEFLKKETAENKAPTIDIFIENDAGDCVSGKHFMTYTVATNSLPKNFSLAVKKNDLEWIKREAPAIKMVCVYDSRDKKITTYRNDKKSLTNLVKYLCSGPRIVSYNGDKFGFPILMVHTNIIEFMNNNNIIPGTSVNLNNQKLTNDSLKTAQTFDNSYDLFAKLYQKLDFMYKLNDLIKVNFKKERKYSGAEITNLSNKKLEEFCKSDVTYITELYKLFIKNNLKVPKVVSKPIKSV